MAKSILFRVVLADGRHADIPPEVVGAMIAEGIESVGGDGFRVRAVGLVERADAPAEAEAVTSYEDCVTVSRSAVGWN